MLSLTIHRPAPGCHRPLARGGRPPGWVSRTTEAELKVRSSCGPRPSDVTTCSSPGHGWRARRCASPPWSMREGVARVVEQRPPARGSTNRRTARAPGASQRRRASSPSATTASDVLPPCPRGEPMRDRAGATESGSAQLLTHSAAGHPVAGLGLVEHLDHAGSPHSPGAHRQRPVEVPHHHGGAQIRTPGLSTPAGSRARLAARRASANGSGRWWSYHGR